MQFPARLRPWLVPLLLSFGVTFVDLVAAAPNSAAPTCTFDGVEYQHRWSRQGQHEFTPAGQPDLVHWDDLITINVHAQVRDEEALAQLANAVLGNYKAARATVVRAFSTPRTPDKPAEHLAVVVFPQLTKTEFVVAHVKLVGGVGCVLVYSHREYGDDSGERVRDWLEANGATLEKKWLAWSGYPSPVALAALPDTPPESR
ncbi:hypothetical protein [Opitutus terrae]|uniref:Lipoprotein, putative n=1 Tax=Opitutus terrae (strain DSM 11246 / JCM 15787 / PB90-1) TaxID=452637 RepID=B1ZSJ2_OPITP|nr:hypothetical protein [Opitutus terrae]ACB73849.1 lipoprotein, putative [Opitutus terrae PB90-1]